MPLESPSLVDARVAFDLGDYEDCVRIIRVLQSAGVADRSLAYLAQRAYLRLGELHNALGQLNLLRRLDPSVRHDLTARRLLGRIIETEVTWLPEVGDVPRGEPRPERATGRRVLHVLKESLPYVETGFTMRSRMTLQAQTLAGFEPEVITSLGFPRTKGVSEYAEAETVDGVRHHRIDTARDVDPLRLPVDAALSLGARLAAPIADAFAPDLVQAGTGYRGFDTALVGLALARRLDVPFVYEVRGFQEATWSPSPARAERGEYYRLRWRQENRCMTEADAVITIADAMAEEIVGRGIPASKVSVVPNAVDVERFTPRRKRADLVEAYGLRDRFVIGYVSNLGAREGIEHLVAAVGILAGEGATVACLVVGDGPQRALLEQQVAELGLGSLVALTGHVPNHAIEDHYALIDLFVVPRIEDRAARLVTPLKPLEAMAMGLPVIASDLPSLRELIAPGERGEVFPPADPRGLAGLIRELMTDDAWRRRLADAGRSWVHAHRTVRSNADRYRMILGPLVGVAQTTT